MYVGRLKFCDPSLLEFGSYQMSIYNSMSIFLAMRCIGIYYGLKCLSDLVPVLPKVMDDLSLDFSALVADVADILNKPPAVLEKLKLVCCNINTAERSLLFSDKESAAIRASSSVFDIFYELRDHWRWDNHRLLFILIKRSGSQEALDRLKLFEKKIDYTKRLTDFTKQFQSARKPLPPGYAKMIAIIQKDYTDFTLKECDELDEYLADCFKSPTLTVPHYESSNSIKVTWYIPIEAVSATLSRAYQAKELFQFLKISYFEIDEIIVWNVKKSYSLQVCMYVRKYVLYVYICTYEVSYVSCK